MLGTCNTHEEARNVCKALAGNRHGNIGRLMKRWENNIKPDVREVRCDDMNRTGLRILSSDELGINGAKPCCYIAIKWVGASANCKSPHCTRSTHLGQTGHGDLNNGSTKFIATDQNTVFICNDAMITCLVYRGHSSKVSVPFYLR
jgi:hypothetical protein